MRKPPLLIVLLLFIVGTLIASNACGEPVAPEQSPVLSKELNIYSRWGYLDPSVIKDFEKQFGMKVNLDTYEDQEMMFSVIQSNPDKYDLIFPTESLVAEMIQSRLLAPLSLAHVRNILNINSEYLNSPYDPGNEYSVPFLWGTTGIAVNTKHITDTINSWEILWNSRYSGKISMLRNPYSVVGIVLKYLGYSLNTSERVQLDEAQVRLLEQKPLLMGYLNPGEWMARLKSGELWLAQAHNGDAIAAKEDNAEIAFVLPDEGSDYYLSCMAIPRDSPHKYSAEIFINYILQPEVHARTANYNHYACPNKAAIDSKLIDAELLGNPAIYQPPRTLIKLESWKSDSGLTRALQNKVWAELGNK